MKNTAVLLGRFSPFHKGHQICTENMIRDIGEDNCLIMIGSSDSYNSRTPYTFDQRKEMIATIFPGVRIVALPDIQSDLSFFDGNTNGQWLDNLEEMENRLGTKFIFYGGGKEDLMILSQRFPTKIAMDRYTGPVISATKVREALGANDTVKLKEFLDPKIIPMAKKYYQEFLNKNNNE